MAKLKYNKVTLLTLLSVWSFFTFENFIGIKFYLFFSMFIFSQFQFKNDCRETTQADKTAVFLVQAVVNVVEVVHVVVVVHVVAVVHVEARRWF